MAHDFDRFPELTNAQMDIYYFESPHKQITDNFTGKVERVHDGDTISVTHPERDFLTQIRFESINAPELNKPEGKVSQSWLEKRLLGKDVDVVLSEQRVEKWGRILGTIYHNGMNVAEELLFRGLAQSWEKRELGTLAGELA